MLATKFIIALCPATPIYLSTPHYSTQGATTRVKAEAFVFDTFEAAMEVAKGIVGWGGAQRVEEIAVNVPAPAPWQRVESLATEDTCNEVRDAATFVWNETLESPEPQSRAVEEVEQAMRELGLKVIVEVRAGASCPVTLYLADHLGNTLQLDFDPMQDGFDITEATCLAEPDHGCAGNCKPLSTKAARALRKWGKEKCQRAWHLNRLRGEGLTVCSIETGIPLRSVDSAINAWQEVWAQLFVPQTCSDCGETNDTVLILDLGDGGHALCSKCDPNARRDSTEVETATCDGCENAFPVDEVEVCGSAEHGLFGFCAACRAKDANAPRE